MAYETFENYSAIEGNPRFENYIKREKEIRPRPGDLRSEFEKDCNRVLHCNAFRRLKHKTQVFFATRNDHICTRIEHVNHVNSISYSIAKYLGLDTELTTAISLGHDLGHAPFGHWGEKVLSQIAQDATGKIMWHEKNSLRFVDRIETLPDASGQERNLNLTYAVRDGIICHCGEVDCNGLRPREKFIDLEKISAPNQVNPYSWEGCVVKISDKIAYLGRDIEDALALGILSESQLKDLRKILQVDLVDINNTIIIHNLIDDLCQHSNPKDGISFSPKYFSVIKAIKDFNYKNIYLHPRMDTYRDYAALVINSLYKTLYDLYDGKDTLRNVHAMQKDYPLLLQTFEGWLKKYSDLGILEPRSKFKNEILYQMAKRKDYAQSIIDFLAGMTDQFAIRTFEELISF